MTVIDSTRRTIAHAEPLLRRLAWTAFLPAALFAAACSGTYKQNLDFDPAEPLRIAILPFGFVNDQGEVIDEDTDLLVDKIPLVSSELGEKPTKFIHTLVTSNMGKTGLDLIPSAIVENDLLHNGLGQGLNPDIKKIYALPPKDLCAKLDCDAVMYGKVFKWDRSYYGVQTVSEIGVELTLVNAQSGKVIFSSRAEDSTSRGITKGPTGWASLVLEPVKGLDNAVITDLARDMVAKMLAPLKVKERPEMLDEAPPAVFASTHDSRSGVIPPNGRLTVLAFGTPNVAASFSLGDKVQNIPMVEKDKGHYIGEYYPVANERFAREPVKVVFVDRFGRQTEQRVGMGPVSVR